MHLFFRYSVLCYLSPYELPTVAIQNPATQLPALNARMVFVSNEEEDLLTFSFGLHEVWQGSRRPRVRIVVGLGTRTGSCEYSRHAIWDVPVIRLWYFVDVVVIVLRLGRLELLNTHLTPFLLKHTVKLDCLLPLLLSSFSHLGQASRTLRLVRHRVLVVSSLLQHSVSFLDNVVNSIKRTSCPGYLWLPRGRSGFFMRGTTSSVATSATPLTALKSLLKPANINVLCLRLHVGTLDHLLEHFDLRILLFDLVLQVFDSRLSELSNLDFSLHQFLLLFVVQLSYTA